MRKRFDDATVERLLASEWWRVRPDLIKGLDYSDVSAMLDRIDGIKASSDDWEYMPRAVTVGAVGA
ncbi:hypothetical protein D3C87_2149550 [compost metagenome]